jgi:hypothetical protein
MFVTSPLKGQHEHLRVPPLATNQEDLLSLFGFVIERRHRPNARSYSSKELNIAQVSHKRTQIRATSEN